MPKNTSIITLIVLGFALLVPSSKTCGELCSRCERGNKCTVCYQTIVQNTKCDYQPDRTKLHCRFGFLLNNGYCSSCEPPYVIDPNTQECIQSSVLISDCDHYVMDPNTRDIKCVTCKGGYPAKNNSVCIPFSRFSDKQALIVAKNCGYGYSEDGKYICARCNEGYAPTQATGFEICGKSPKPGCMFAMDTGECSACNTYFGYYDAGEGDCVKKSGVKSLDIN